MNEDVLREIEKLNNAISANESAANSLLATNKQLQAKRTELEAKLDKTEENKTAAEKFIGSKYHRPTK